MRRAFAAVLAALLATPAAAQVVRLSGPDDDHHFGDVGNAGSDSCRLNRSGRYVLFASHAGNLVAGDDNGERDLFLRDRQTQATVRLNVSVNADDNGNLSGDEHDLSADGRRIVFVSRGLLGAGIGNGEPQVLLLDRSDGSVRLVSHTPGGDPSAGPASQPRISADGRYVAFVSAAGDLVPGVDNNLAQVFRYEVASGLLVPVSVRADGAVGAGESTRPSLSADGQRVAFVTTAINLLTDAGGVPVPDTNAAPDAVFKTWPLQRVRLASVDDAGLPLAAGAADAVLSGDGNSIAFTSNDVALRSDPANDSMQVYVRRIDTGNTEAVSLDAAQAMADGWTRDPRISEDGRWIAFATTATNLVGSAGATRMVVRDTLGGSNALPIDAAIDGAPGLSGNGEVACAAADAPAPGVDDNNHATDIVLRRVDGSGDPGVASLATVPTTWAGGHTPTLSADGRVVVFASAADNILAGLPSARLRVTDLVHVDLATGVRRAVLPTHDGLPLADGYTDPVLSADATQLLFQSRDPVLAGSTLLRLDLHDGRLLHLAPTRDGQPPDDHIDDVHASGDGAAVVFATDASNLVATPATHQGETQVYLWRGATGAQVVSRTPGGDAGNDHSRTPALSRDGRCVAFSSRAALVAAPLPDGDHLHLYRVDTDTLQRIDPPADGRIATRIAIDADCRQLFALRMPQIAARGSGGPPTPPTLHRHDIAQGIWTTLAPGIVDLAPDVLALSGDGRYLLLRAGRRGTPTQLWRYDTRTGALRAATPPLDSAIGEYVGIADDGRRAVFNSGAATLDPAVIDNNAEDDVFLVELPVDAVFDNGFE